MPYALYIDESGNFKENNMTGSGRTSIVGGWIVRNDEDHDILRKKLNEWYASIANQLTKKEFHATEWRKHEQGRVLLSRVFTLADEMKPFSIVFIENRSGNLSENADSTYLDMLVELIVNSIFDILDSRKDREALPLQVYVAERKGVPDWEIQKLVLYRLRALLSGSIYKNRVNVQKACTIHIRKLKQSPDLLLNSQSRSREKTALMPELILADFLCNTLYQMEYFKDKPDQLTSCQWHPQIYIQDPFWNELQTYKNQKRWVEIIVEIVSESGSQWSKDNPAMKAEFDLLLDEAMKKTVSKLSSVNKLLSAVFGLIHDRNRDLKHASAIIQIVESCLSGAPSHLVQILKWHLSTFRLSIANHQGDNKEAEICFDEFCTLFENPEYQRSEFLQSVSDNYNRYAVAMTDRYEFEQTEKILRESIAVEETFLKTEFTIQNRLFKAHKSDGLGKIYSNLGQLYSKMAYRDPEKSLRALDCFDKAESHMQQSLDLPRQKNYRIEALLLSPQDGCEDTIYNLLAEGSEITPETLFSTIEYDSFNAMYWLRWMLMPKNKRAKPYKQELRKQTYKQLPAG